MNYEVDKKTGDLSFVKFVGGNGPDTPTLFYLVRPNEDMADLVIWDSGFAGPKKKIAEIFSENQTIYEGIKSGKLKASDIQYILDEMAGGKKSDVPLETIPQVQTDSVSNGQIGDDE